MEQIQFLKALGDETRLRAILLMALEGELCVCELMVALELPQPKISRHMGLLRDVGILKSRRQAQWVFYRLNPDLDGWQGEVVYSLIAGAKGQALVQEDSARLTKMKNRPVKCEPV